MASPSTDPSPKIRAFFALALPAPERAVIEKLQRTFASRNPFDRVRWIPPAALHITLKFLGAVETRQLPQLLALSASAIEPLAPISVSLKDIGYFPGTRRAQIVWIGLSGGLPCVTELQKCLEAAASHCGFEREARAFHPHVTIGRWRDPVAMPKWAVDLDGCYGDSWQVKEVLLKQSLLSPKGAIYRDVAALPLRGIPPWALGP